MITFLKKILPILLRFLPGLFRSISLAIRERKKQKVLRELEDAVNKAEDTKDTSDLENLINLGSRRVRDRDQDPPKAS